MSKNKTQVAIFGASGRMGLEIQALVENSADMDLMATVDPKAKSSLKDMAPRKPQVVIDFSSPQGTVEAAKWCAENKVPLVTGTTGLSKEQQKAVFDASRKIPVFKSANMGIGINVMASLFGGLLRNFPATEIEFEEVHHRHKKDKPSGTALFLKDEIEQLNPKARVGEPTSLRGGEVFGIHRVYFFAEGEWICFEHQATDRSVFARGALKAAQWLVGKPVGLYSMKDLIKTRRE